MRVRVLTLFTLALTFVGLTAWATPAAAITHPTPDAGQHPYVGLVIFDIGGQPSHRCSGTLLSPTVFLTAGHCTIGTDAARVWFDEQVTNNPEYPYSGSSSYDGVPYTYPNFCESCGRGLPKFITGDLGIVVLAEPVPTSVLGTYGQLPEPWLVDALSRTAPVDLVGYGVQLRLRGGGQPVWTGLRDRFQANARLVSGAFVHADHFLRITANPGQDKGGACFGDSGGPVLTDEGDTVLAVTSYGTNENCAGVGYYFRIDTPDELAWIQSFLQ